MTTIIDNPDSPADLLDAVYRQLEFDQGSLLPATPQPQPEQISEWVEKGDWQQLAAQVGADRIFFVDSNPVVVFAKTIDTAPDTLRTLYERIWCMARPQLLFLATPGELSAFDLTKPPPKPHEAIKDRNRLITVANSVADVQSKLEAFHRERIETGAVFGEKRFRDSLNRSDRALIRDLRTVRQQLTGVVKGSKPPELRYLHSLIGRAIFVRYLEDREVLLPAYFEKVAASSKRWQKILATPPSTPALDARFAELRFLRVLRDKEFTYAVFRALALDFNGDIFPIEAQERDQIQQAHLDSLRGFLTGSPSDQENLFFFAYRFDVIPIELISTIYEEFYNERTEKGKNQGSHYTPPTLVEYVLARTLTPDVLARKPRVIDPACGSGIFLVESFRRMVRHLCAQQNGRRVSPPQLRRLLRDQIAGVDVNEEAVRVAAFSLYLAFLHYQEPREINDERRLPYLKWVPSDERHQRERTSPGAHYLDVLLHANSFEIVDGKHSLQVSRRFGEGCASVVVGNPPWGKPKKKDSVGQEAMKAVEAWCDPNKGRPIGYKELSQAFIHLTGTLLKEGGRAGLLVSSGVLFKHHKNSREFRRVWLQSVRLEQIVNFGHVRRVFFSGTHRNSSAVSPFISVVFEKTASMPADSRFQYWSAKRTAVVENVHSVILNRGDMNWLSQQDCLEYEKLWKIYWWGGHRDELLIRSLERFPALRDLPKQHAGVKFSSGRGFAVSNKKKPADWLGNYPVLSARKFHSFGPILTNQFESAPANVEHRGFEDAYRGRRFLIARGIKAGGHITARFETKKYCFRNSIHGICIKGLETWQEAVITAVFWSSLARYYFFVTAGSWGLWHDEIHLESLEELPIRFPEDASLRDRIVGIVKELQNLD
ncbi:MAG: N-6 DNA methylase, partial [Chloroflexi bacterium]|nr:N-6 DNA methylase [Chloroflexota bacterium]